MKSPKVPEFACATLLGGEAGGDKAVFSNAD
jgi:hypothetical protein